MASKLLFGECDCCGTQAVLSSFFAMGAQCDTAACYSCRGMDPIDFDEPGEIADEIQRMRPKAETAEQWADICAMEARYVALTGQKLPV